MTLRYLLITSVALVSATPALAQESAADAAVRQVQESRQQRAAERAERVDALNARIRSYSGRDEGDPGVRTGSSFERGERAARSIERQVDREAIARANRLDGLSAAQATLIPQGQPLGAVDPLRTTGRRVLELRDPAAAQRWRNAWRQDPRFDWRALRLREPAAFQVASPPGVPRRSRPRIGSVIANLSPAEWLREPWTVRLPPVTGPYRWTRIGRDVALVDRRSGQLVDVVPDFFLPSVRRR